MEDNRHFSKEIHVYMGPYTCLIVRSGTLSYSLGMMTKKMKSEAQWMALGQRFRELRLEDPDRPSFSVLTWAVMEGGYSATTIKRGVDHLVDEDDYCEDISCRGECNRPHDKTCLKNWLLHLAYPPVLKVVRLTKEEVLASRANAGH